MTAQSRLLAAELRAGHKRALVRLEKALGRSGGSVSAAAQSLGIRRSTLYLVADAVPAVRAVLDAGGMGVSGAQERATAARKSPAKSRGSKKSDGSQEKDG